LWPWAWVKSTSDTCRQNPSQHHHWWPSSAINMDIPSGDWHFKLHCHYV
jgi:hypothetical protein